MARRDDLSSPSSLRTVSGVSRRDALTILAGGVAATVCGACSPRSSMQGQGVSTDEPLHYASLLDVARLIKAREISPVELTELILARIKQLDGRLHSYLAMMGEDALAAARVAEAEIADRKYRGPLHGIPLAVKDLCYTKGVPTTGGLAVRSDFKPEFDATVVTRLKNAGAVILGKLNLTEGAMVGYHPYFEIPVNPWGRKLAVRGSSSGSAVATAAGLCFGSLGCGTGGSICSPSAASGVVGLKPTYGRVSRHGIHELARSLDHVGPMTRNVSDAAAIFQVIAGPDENDPTTLEEKVPNILRSLTGTVGDLRVGYDEQYATARIDSSLVEAMTAALQTLEGLGVEVVEVKMPEFAAEHFNMWIGLCGYEAVRAHAGTFPARETYYGKFMRGFLKVGSAVSERHYKALRKRRAEFSDRFRSTVSGVDAVLCPAGHVPRSAYREVRYGGLPNMKVLARTPDFRFTLPADFAGTPTITLPCGANDAGAPLAMQLMGRPLGEEVLCRLAFAYEQASEWRWRHPPI